MRLKRVDLFRHLNETCYKSLESATILCKTRGNPFVDIGHWLNQIIYAENTDLHCIINYFNLDTGKLSADLALYLDKLDKGALSIKDFSPQIELTVKEAWMIASIVQAQGAIRSSHLLWAMKDNNDLCLKLYQISLEFKKINIDLLQDEFNNIVQNSNENAVFTKAKSDATGQAKTLMTSPSMGKEEAISLYTIDLTQKAREHEIDDIVGRDVEIRKIIDILLRRRQNNPIITGEAGVGKTAVVEGFAIRLAANDVPDALKGSRLLSLDLGLLQAGASMKGEFENRLKQLIEEIKTSDTPTILFIDEVHTLIGAGGVAGQNDAANLLKPALARGQLRCIGATTYKEYVKYFEKDPALTRRFENILIDEPNDDNAIKMLRKLAPILEKHHKVKLLDEAIISAVKLSRRYIPTRQLPDKAVSVLDTACSKVALSRGAKASTIEFIQKEIESLKNEKHILLQEIDEGFDHTERLEDLTQDIISKEEALKKLEEQFIKEKELVNKYDELKDKIAKCTDDNSKILLKNDIDVIRKDLLAVQENHPLILAEVDTQAVSTVISEWTGVPVKRMVSDEVKGILDLKDQLTQNIIGQDHALSLLARRMVTARANLADPNRPIAVLMFAGPSGVGKTETALTLARLIYGSERNLITINMSEFQESHTVSTLKGAPPGYVGYGEGGVLTEAVRRKPYSIVLLDEVEKAHKDVHKMFFQVFDKGQMEDGSGRLIDFTNTVIILTTNVGDDIITHMCSDDKHVPSPDKLEEAIRGRMLEAFPAALLGRINIIPFYPLSRKTLKVIIDLKLQKVIDRVLSVYKVKLCISESIYDEILSRCNNIVLGARLIDAVINNDILPDISSIFLESLLDKKDITELELVASDGSFKLIPKYVTN